ncbi:hypothetical protein TNCV_430631 [Trichonephila clavipes]|nr:hypothetical protein TNCV_430631 [Trichonephila clavipes]
MIWAAISFFPAIPIVPLKGRIAGEKYRSILADWVHPMLQTLFPVGLFQDDKASFPATGLVFSCAFAAWGNKSKSSRKFGRFGREVGASDSPPKLEWNRAKSYCHLYGAQDYGQRLAYI